MSMENFSKRSKNKFIMLCGLPGSGKTTLAKRLLDEETVWISSDKLREEAYGSEDTQGDSGVIFAEMKKRTLQALNDQKSVIYDACNINSKKRRGLLRELKRIDCIKQCIICATPYEECIERAMSRSRVVGETVIKRMYMNWNTPYYYEGWDEIDIYYSDSSKCSMGSYLEYAAKYMDYDQETPYHLESLGVHMQGAGEYLIDSLGHDKEENLVLAGFIHDCGKPFTKGFKDSRGNPCEIAHYYQHQCTGAYDSLFFDYGDKTNADILEISCLVYLHMNPFNWCENKTKEKYKSLWGDDLYCKVMELHEADEKASKKE